MVVEKLSVYILGYELENLCVVVHQVELIFVLLSREANSDICG